MTKTFRSYVHVTIQFGIIFYFIVKGPVFASGVLLGIELTGIFLGLWAIWAMRHSYLSIFPEPAHGFNLIEKGPYYLIRHPMYTALFITLIPLVIANPAWDKLAAILFFIVNQVLKLIYEEHLIQEHVPDYSDYMKRTWRILPYVF